MPQASHNLDAEKSVLGAILLNNRLFYECGGLRPEYFSLEAHRKIFSKMTELDSSGRPIDTVILGDALEGQVTIAALSELIDGVPERPSIAEYVNIVCDSAKRRHLALSCEGVIAKSQDSTEETNAILDAHEDVILRLRAAGTAKKAVHVREVIPTVLNEISAQRSHPGRLIGMSTGIDSIDYTTTGIRPGEYWVIGAAPSRGKTVLACQFIAVNAREAVPCIAFSYEMTKEQFVKRMLPAYSGIPAQRVRDFRYGTEEQERQLGEAAAEIAGWPFWVCDPEGMSVQELVAVAKLHIRRHGVKLAIVDYLQIIDGPGDVRTRVGAVSNALRALAKTEKIAVVALSQLRRPATEDERPTMFHLKETGDIEAHANTIVLIYRPKGEQMEWSGLDEIIIAKQREGLVGSENVVLDPKSLWFRPREFGVVNEEQGKH
jgi:replicative DNA helicase